MSEKLKDVHFSYEEQLYQFLKRGVKVKNKEEAIHRLKHLSYYKIKEQAQIFRDEKGNYKDDTYFEGIIQNFYYDKNLRMEFLKCSEKIELSIKARISYILGLKYGAFGYLKFSTWCDRKIPKNFILKEEENLKKKILKKMKIFSTNPLVREFISENPNEKYLSIWRLGEVLTFGEILNLFNLMSQQNKILIAKIYNLSVNEFVSYINCIKLLRNFCAHNMSIINLKLKTIPHISKNFKEKIADINKVATPILIMVYFIKIINKNYNFKDLLHTIKQISENINILDLGFSSLEDFISILKN